MVGVKDYIDKHFSTRDKQHSNMTFSPKPIIHNFNCVFHFSIPIPSNSTSCLKNKQIIKKIKVVLQLEFRISQT